MAFHDPTESDPAYARVLIMGEPGVGKTLLASTLDETFILDLEGRAAHAKRHRMTFTKDRQGLNSLQQEMRRLAALTPGDDGALTHKVEGVEFPVRVVQLDSLDELQLNIDLALTSSGFDYWREMLKLMRGYITTGRTLNAHFICIAHTREFSPDPGSNALPKVDLALQGQAAQQIPRWFDLVLNIIMNPQTQQVEVLTQPTVIAKRVYMAKDALHLFKGRKFPLHFVGDRPDPKVMTTILDATVGGITEKMFEEPGHLGKKTEGEIRKATQKPLTGQQFEEVIKKRNWDYEQAVEMVTAKFGKGYDASRAQEYLDYLQEQLGD